MGKFDQLKQRPYENNMILPKQDLVVATFGNASVVDRENGIIAIKPGGVEHERFKPGDMVIVAFDGK